MSVSFGSSKLLAHCIFSEKTEKFFVLLTPISVRLKTTSIKCTGSTTVNFSLDTINICFIGISLLSIWISESACLMY